MKTTGVILSALLISVPTYLPAAQTASATLFCWSLRCQGATAVDGIGFEWHLDLSRFSDSINGEFGLNFFGSSHSHSAHTALYSEFYDQTYSGSLRLNIPEAGDANGNLWDDFFEVSQSASGLVSSGLFNNTTITASWYREAGSASGTCALRLPDPWFPGESMQFNHSFEVIEYRGTISYIPGTNSVSAYLDLVQTGVPGNTLQGPIQFAKYSANVFTLKTASLTNGAGQMFNLSLMTPFQRDSILLTNYYGAVEFTDGEPGTADNDYYDWELSIDDLNDRDQDGIPDFSDDPSAAVLPRQPSLALTLGATNLLLTISGQTNRLHHLLENTGLATGNWTTNQSLTLTNDPQTISLPLPVGVMKFWRLVVP